MGTSELYNKMISKVISPYLKSHGFLKNHHTYYYTFENNWGLIGFQKSSKSDANNIVFTINVGVISQRILSFYGQDQSKKKPDIWETHWRSRIGHLMLENEDVWWSIDQETDVEKFGQSLLEKIETFVLPNLHKIISDSSLRDLWLSGKAPSLTDFQRLMFLCILLKQIGPSDLVNPTINEIKRISENRPTAVTADVFIEKLRSI